MDFKTDKGFAGEYFVTADLILKGYGVLHPCLPNTPFDLVVYTGESFVKVQVKTGTFDENGKLFIYLRRKKNESYSDSDFDVLAVYETSSNKIAYMPFEERKKLTFSKEGTRKTTSLSLEDYSEFPRINA